MLAQQPVDQLADMRLTQRRKRELMRTGEVREGPRIVGPVHDEQCRTHSGYYRREVGKQRLADAVNPLSVVNDVNRGRLAGQRNTLDEVDKATAPGVRIDIGTRVAADAEQVIEQKQILGGAGLGDLAANLCPSLLGGETGDAQ